MGKQGPCCHCGVASTPLWRNGPPNKPVLCNACGSRWRTKGTLVNYAPLHARGNSATELENRGNHEGVRPLNSTKLRLLHAAKAKLEASLVGNHIRDKPKATPAIHEKDTPEGSIEEDTGNRSSSMSGISYSESSTQFDRTDGNEIADSVQSHAWDTQIPSRKRTSLKRPTPTSVEKLQKELSDILHEQESSYLSELSEVLVFGSETPFGSVEIGLGSMLIKPPLSTAAAEESEGCSFPSENKHFIKNRQYREVSLPLLQSGSYKSSSSNVSNDRVAEAMEMRKQSGENYPKRIALVSKVL
ncbi:GATA transcription factor 26-like [Nymphaea colorata]|nr:GATA transcription factor 26-like [Nymphaea colorata]